MSCSHISSYMPEKHKAFRMSNILFIPVMRAVYHGVRSLWAI
jgi:hypothetical protein